jgi:hypothetical protein
MRVLWFLCGNESTPSSRIHGIRVHEKLTRMGYSSQIVHKAPRYMEDLYYPAWTVGLFRFFISRSDTVVFQKVNGPRAVRLLRSFKSKGVRTVFIDCDMPLKTEMASLCDVTICPSVELVNRYQGMGFSSVYCIADAVESFLPPHSSTGEKKTIVWYGKSRQGKWEGLEWFRKEVLPWVKDKWKFVTVSDHIDSTFKWEAATAPGIINKADLAIIPVSQNDYDQVKSANRCTQSMALGVPVLCNYTRSYREVIVDNHNGLVSDHKTDWIAFIRRMEDDKLLAATKANAFRTAERYSIDNLVHAWISCLKIEQNNNPAWSLSILLLSRLLAVQYAVKKVLSRIRKRVQGRT